VKNLTIVKAKTPREQLIQSIKRRIEAEKMAIKQLERELKEHKEILKILYKSLEMLRESEEK